MKLYKTEALQVEEEIAAFCALLAREGVRSYLEIGSKFGGSLWRVGQALAPGAKIVSVDMPGGTKRWKESSASLQACAAALTNKGHDVHLIWDDSTKPATVEAARALGPFDAILIDGDHRMPGVTKDFANYGPMGRMIAFHDIAWKRAPEWVGTRIDVPEFWASVKGDYARTEEFVFCPTGKNNGIGVLWRD